MKESSIDSFILSAKNLYHEDFINLHRPVFEGNEKKYLEECIDSNYVSSVGKRVNEFEDNIAKFNRSKHAVATVNGTSALHISLKLLGVNEDCEVITQALTFVATCNAIAYCNARPIFIDVDRDTLGMSPNALKKFLNENVVIVNNKAINKKTNKHIQACMPMHTFGMPCRIDEIANICAEWNISLIEDCAESLGSSLNGTMLGNFGAISAFSFNGNKLITTGGGGMIITNNKSLAKKAKHITTTAKLAHDYEFVHDEIGYNYRMPNINAALGCAQLEKISSHLLQKSKVHNYWKEFFHNIGIPFVSPIDNAVSNHWLNAIILNSKKDRDNFLTKTNQSKVMTRPIWTLMNKLPMFLDCQNDGLENSKFLEERLVNIPSSVPNGSIL